MEPYEILISPYEVWLAPVGESFPDVDTTPGGNWGLLGANGKFNIAEDGVTVTHNQTIEKKRTVGSTGPVKAVRTEEDLMISFILLDMTLEAYRKTLNDVTVTDTAAGSGTPGYREITLRQGREVAVFAMLVKGKSPYGDDWYGQYQIPKVFVSGNPTPKFNKADEAALAFEFTALEDPDAASEEERFGKLVMQDATALA